jgi:hypothetical protein
VCRKLIVLLPTVRRKVLGMHIPRIRACPRSFGDDGPGSDHDEIMKCCSIYT